MLQKKAEAPGVVCYRGQRGRVDVVVVLKEGKERCYESTGGCDFTLGFHGRASSAA